MGDDRGVGPAGADREDGMNPAGILVVFLFLFAGLALGWFAQRAYIAHNDIRVGHQRVRGGRRTRWRAGVIAAGIGIVLAIALFDFVTNH